MTLAEIRTSMDSLGYRFRPESSFTNDPVVGRFWKKMKTSKKDASGDGPNFEVVLFDRLAYDRNADRHPENRFSFAVDLKFEAVRDVWVSISAYSTRPDEFLKTPEKYEKLLQHYFESL